MVRLPGKGETEVKIFSYVKISAVATMAAAGCGFSMPAAASDDLKEIVEVPAPPQGKAQVVFFRPGGFGGSAISCAVSENGAKISSLPPARFFILVAEPGRHIYSAASESKDEVAYNLKEGQTVYVKCGIQAGFLVGRPRLENADELEFSTKTWKSVTEDRISANVLTDAQIKAALDAQKAAPQTPAAAAAPAAPVAPVAPVVGQ